MSHISFDEDMPSAKKQDTKNTKSVDMHKHLQDKFTQTENDETWLETTFDFQRVSSVKEACRITTTQGTS